MLGHLSIGVRDLDKAGQFYNAVMAPIGWVRLWTGADGLGYGPPGGGDKLNVFVHPDAHPPGPGFHLCFNARSEAAVAAFHAAALANGGIDNGAPASVPATTRTTTRRSSSTPRGGNSRPCTRRAGTEGQGRSLGRAGSQRSLLSPPPPSAIPLPRKQAGEDRRLTQGPAPLRPRPKPPICRSRSTPGRNSHAGRTAALDAAAPSGGWQVQSHISAAA